MSEAKKKVFCPRNRTDKPIGEHLACPYCFAVGNEAVERGDHERFCSYDEEKDPVVFGFPDGSARGEG